jgi:hypothetical protein
MAPSWPRRCSIADERCRHARPAHRSRISETITISQPTADGNPWASRRFAKLNWAGDPGKDMLVYRGVKGMANRCLVIERLVLFGNGYAGAVCGDCLKLLAPEGDPGSIYKFTLRDIFTNYGTRGIVLEGAVFEGMGENIHAENHRSDGIAMLNTYVPGEHNGIVSNVMLIHPNSSRNMGAGIRAVQSCNIFMGSFILNADGGVVAPDGIRYAAACNGENTGESVFVVPYAGWGSEVSSNTGATNGQTLAVDWSSGQPVEKGQIAKFLLDNASKDVPQHMNSMVNYGAPTDPPTDVLKP